MITRADRARTPYLQGDGELPAGFPWRSIPRLAADQAARTPDAIALRFPDSTMTYRELCRRAAQTAAELRRLGVGRGDIVAVLDERSARLVTVLLGILWAGAAYLPLDPANPAERHRLMVRDCGAAMVLAADHLAVADLPTVSLDMLGTRVSAGTAGPGVDVTAGVDGNDLAYIMYTSGSTGTPKGVMVPHRAVVRLATSTDYVRLGETDVVAFASNIAFDASTFEIWAALLTGATVYGLEPDVLLSSYLLGPCLEREGVTALFLTTALFHLHARLAPETFRSLRYLLTGGEVMNPDAARAVLAAGGPERLLHMYGPTEATTFSTAYRVRSVPAGSPSVPIGRAVAHATAHVLDSQLRAVPVAEVGELYIGGPGVAWGYTGRPGASAAAFLADPSTQGERLYRTGDHVRQLPSGDLDFVGRTDDQVKVRGFRIELAEVECTLRALPAVRDAAVVTVGHGEARDLVAYVVMADPAMPESSVTRQVAATLPPQMVPSLVVAIEGLPLTTNGKVNRASLARIPLRRLGRDDANGHQRGDA